MRKNKWRTLFVVLLVLCMLGQTVAVAAETQPTDELSFSKVDDSAVTASIAETEDAPSAEQEKQYADTDVVRVSIMMESPSTIDQGYSTRGIAQNTRAMAYHQQAIDNQFSVQRSIERKIGQQLDVEWNLALIANMISANVEYGQIEKIKQVEGVADVLLEQIFYPDVYSDNDAQPNMIFAGETVGATETWASGYTGAGSRVAIVDTGLDTDHQSVSAAAYEYALRLNAEAKDMDYDEYVAGLNLLDTAEIKEILPKLNASNSGGSDASKLYINSKIPYGFSYSTRSYDVTHDNDNAGNHGSHVAGIAAANRFIEKNGEMVSALEETYVAGTAPDAQILVMDVFGDMGAASGDIVAAVEDAILLGADTVNLSLGTTFPGFSAANSLGGFLEKLKNSDTVATISAGNSYDWAYLSRPGTLYADDVNTFTGGEPGTGANALTIASVENVGKIVSGSLTVGGQLVDYSENFTYSSTPKNTPIIDMDQSTDGTGTDYEYVLFEHLSYADSYNGYEDLVKGKVVLCSRGDNSFSDKANNAAKAGAIAVMIYNNVSGSINMDLSELQYEIPCVFITREASKKFISAGEEKTGSDGQTYYTGTLRIAKGKTVVPGVEGAAMEMSFFSSWGVTGDLALKPEISAPGGGIYSIDGSHKNATDRYTTMSGTSMAAPQLAGIGALVQQAIAEKGYKATGFANANRGLTQSLLMSTAIPIKDANGNYYPVIQQGAGMANAVGATAADSYIKMDKKATESYDDGKVKAELGDDSEREGVYTFTFTINNLDGKVHTYDLSADVFTQDSYEALAKTGSIDLDENLDYKTYFMDRDTRMLEADTTFTVNGAQAAAVTVPANGSVTVKASIKLRDSARNYLDTYLKNGNYIQAYVFAEGRADDEGVAGTCHSIPVLAFYGNWTDPSMYYGVSVKEGQFLMNFSTPSTTDASRWAYFEWTDAWQGGTIPTYNHFKANTGSGKYTIGGNPLSADTQYWEERNAVSGDLQSVYWEVWLARNATSIRAMAKDADTGKVYGASSQSGEYIAAYMNNQASDMGGWSGTIGLTQLPAEGARVEFTVRALPEYYQDDKMGADSTPGEGAFVRATATVDGTIPEATAMKLNALNQSLTVTAEDNNYISAVVLYNATGDQVLSFEGAKQYAIAAGTSADYELDLSAAAGTDFHVQVFDYAGNMATYRVVIKDGIMNYAGAMLAYDRVDNKWVQVDKHKDHLGAVLETDSVYNAATAIGDTIFAVSDKNKLYAISASDLDDATLVKSLQVSIADLAYNAADQMLYGVTDENRLVRIDPKSGAATDIGLIPVSTNTLACDAGGTFYCNKYETGEIYAFTLQTLESGITENYDFDADGTVTAMDSQLLLDHVVGGTELLAHADAADLDGDGDVDTYDVYLLQQKVDYYPEQIAAVSGMKSKYLQAMEIDPNNGTLYWASYFTDFMGAESVGFSILYEINVSSGEVTKHYDYWNQLTGLVILDKDYSRMFPPVDGLKNLELSEKAAALAAGEEIQLEAAITPWNTVDKAVVWSSSDESVAVVDQNGVVKAIADGTCQITATSAADSSLCASCVITVGASAPAPEAPAEVCAAAAVNNTQKDLYLTKQAETVTVDLVLSAVEETTNGLQTVSFEATLLELMSVSCDGLSSYTVSGDLATVGFVPAAPVAKDGELARLTFRVNNGGMDADLLIRELQRNNDHVDIESAKNLQGHVWSDWAETSAPDCNDAGEEMRTCSDCGETETRAIPATGDHDWGDWQETREPTDTVPGERTRTCTDCGTSETAPVHVTDAHIWSNWTVVTEAGCGTDGEKVGTCTDCGETYSVVLPATGDHSWGSWTENQDGTKTRACTGCDATQTKVMTAGREGIAVEENFNFFTVGQHLIRDVQITGATVNRVTKLEAEPEEGENYRLHYLIELSQYANDVDSVHAKFRVSEHTASGIGSAFVDTKKGSVNFDGDVTDYDIDISSGTGSMEAWSYWNSSTCAAIKLEFVIAEDGDPYMDPYVYYGNTTVNSLAIWDAEVTKETTVRSSNTVYSYIWLSEDTPDDAVVGIQLKRNGDALALPEGWSKDGGYVQLVDGEAVVAGVQLRGSGLDYWDVHDYVFYIKNHHMTLAPELLQGSEITLQAEMYVPFSVDFREYFGDGNGDTLTYVVSVDGAEAAEYTSQKYRFTPKNTNSRVLTVYASDGALTSEVCTITIQPIADHVWSEWKTTVPAACVADGEEMRACICCGEAEVRALPCTGAHTWGEWQEVVDESGEQTGAKLRQCYICGEYKRDGGVLYGDVDGDGEVLMSDVIALSRYCADWGNAIDPEAADVNADGVVDMGDVIKLRRYLADWDGIILGKA